MAGTDLEERCGFKDSPLGRARIRLSDAAERVLGHRHWQRGPSVEAGPELFYYGKLKQVVRAPLPEVHDASLRVIREMVSQLIEERADSRSAHLKSKSPHSEPLWVDLEALGDEQTRITIRAGLSGDEDRERYVLSRIKKLLVNR